MSGKIKSLILYLLDKYLPGILIGIAFTLLFATKCFNNLPVVIKEPIVFKIKVPEIVKDTTLVDSIQTLKNVLEFYREVIRSDSLRIKELLTKIDSFKYEDKSLKLRITHQGPFFPIDLKYNIKERTIKIDTLIQLKVKPRLDWKLGFLIGAGSFALGYITSDFLNKK